MRWRWLLFHPQLSQKSQIQFHQIPYGQQKPLAIIFVIRKNEEKSFHCGLMIARLKRSSNSAFHQALHFGNIVERNLWSQNPKQILASNLADFESFFFGNFSFQDPVIDGLSLLVKKLKSGPDLKWSHELTGSNSLVGIWLKTDCSWRLVHFKISCAKKLTFNP